MDAVAVSAISPLSRLKLFFALSRTPHGLLDLAAPALAAVLCLGGFPSFKVTVLGLITAFAAYTAVYALNDLVDLKVDREKVREDESLASEGYLDALMVRHPLARGFLSLPEGLLWAGSWALIALAGAYLLNPLCALILLAGCLLETAYCLLLSVSHLRALVSGVVKTLGPLAAVYAVDPRPSSLFLLLLFLWLFFWEIGGQNIPADWHDVDRDRRVHARTIPVRFGPRGAAIIICLCLSLAVALSPLVLLPSPARLSWLPTAGGLAVGACLLLLPAWRLYRTQERAQAAALFNRASYYPLAMLLLVLAGFVL